MKIFHAGTRLDDGRVITDGGRVLCVVGAGDSVRSARDATYEVVRKVAWDGAFFRSDSGHRALSADR